MTIKHPAKFSEPLLPIMARYVDGARTILDPFAGTGRVGWLRKHLTVQPQSILANEIEPAWQAEHAGNGVDWSLCRDARNMAPWITDDRIDAISTSPCMAHGSRLLTADLRWVLCEEIRVGDELMAFDEYPIGIKPNGQPNRRRWKKATVVRSFPDRKPCVRVVLENGDSIVTTREHPWLANRYEHASKASSWVPAEDLMSSPFVLKQMDTWDEDRSYEAGWLAGMFDGEGSLSLGWHGSPKLMLCQCAGPIMDQAESWLNALGHPVNRIARTGIPAQRKPIHNLYVTGGFPGMMRALGSLRPARLLDKWATLDVTSRTIEPRKVRVLAVEDVGDQDIQVIETSAGTYIAEGYMMHNCYGNRMADACDWAPGRKHSTYTSALRETVGDPTAVLRAGNAGAEQWGHSYREIHRAAWAEAWRVLTPGGRLVLNIADHYRAGQLQRVPEWHVSALLALGFVLLDWCEVETDRYGFGANAELRAPELVIVIEKPGKGPAFAWDPETVTLHHGVGGLWDVEPEPVQLSLLGGAS